MGYAGLLANGVHIFGGIGIARRRCAFLCVVFDSRVYWLDYCFLAYHRVCYLFCSRFVCIARSRVIIVTTRKRVMFDLLTGLKVIAPTLTYGGAGYALATGQAAVAVIVFAAAIVVGGFVSEICKSIGRK